jgi:hypothetical protein
MIFDKSRFLAASLKPETVVVPGFGPVGVRPLRADEYERFEAACERKGPDGKLVYRTDRAILVRMAAVHPETGEPVFTDDDLPAIRTMPTAFLLPVARVALKLCGVGEDAAGN